MHQHGIPRVDPGQGAIDVRLGILPAADDDDVKPEVGQTPSQPGEGLATKTQVAGAKVGRSDDERQPHLQPRGMYDPPPPGDEASRASSVAFRALLEKLQRTPALIPSMTDFYSLALEVTFPLRPATPRCP